MKYLKIRTIALMAVIFMPLLSAAQDDDAFHQETNAVVNPGEKARNVGMTPQMGWSSWNRFGCDINEQTIRQMADLMVDLGLRDAGYVYLNIDDCWHGERDADGFIHENAEKFPSGMKALADYVHSKGLKLGIYSDAGRKTCGGHPGSFGHEYQDALTYARWGIDYLKYDWCQHENINPKGAYGLMRDALAAAGRPIFFSMCEWGSSQPWEWAAGVGHSWRTTGDIGASFREDIQHDTWRQLSVLTIVDLNDKLREYAGPGHWNDPDMLECGNGMSIAQDRSHFTLWAMMAAPLILGNDLANMSDEVYAIITNKDVIAINQDPLGIQGFRKATRDGIEYWFKPMEGGRWAMTIFNRNAWDAECILDWQKFNFTDELSNLSTDFDKTIYSIKDVWNNCPAAGATTAKGFSFTMPAEDVVTFILSPAATQATFDIAPGDNNWIFTSTEPISIDFTACNWSDKPLTGKYTLSITTDTHKPLKSFKQSIKLKAGENKAASFKIGKMPAGFYSLTLTKEGGYSREFTIGVDPDKVISATDRQPDFQQFWDRARAELAAVAPDYRMELMPEKCNATGLVYKVTMNSLAGHRLQCFLSVPAEGGKHPVIINYNGYSSTCWIPEPNERFCIMTVSTRGQGEIEENIYGDWIRYNIDNPDTYYYKYAFMDVVRAIDFAAQCSYIDSTRMFAQGGSQGGAFTLVACALDSRIRAAAPDVPFLGDYPDYFQIVSWPASAVFEAQKDKGLTDEQLYRNLSYFDIKNLTPWIKCPIFMAFGLQDTTCPPHTNFSGFNNIPHSEKQWIVYPLSGHDVWTITDWDSQRWHFYEKYL